MANPKPPEAAEPAQGPRPTEHSYEGFFAYGNAYLKAYDCLADSGQGVGAPSLACLAQSLELLAKSYLLYCGLSEYRIARRPFAHDIAACLKEARKRGLRLEVGAEERVALNRLSKLNAGRQFNYLYEREKHLPNEGLLRALAGRLRNALFDLAFGDYLGGVPRPTPEDGDAKAITLHLIEDGIAARGHFHIWWALRNLALPQYLEAMNVLVHVDFFHASNSGHYKLFFIARSRIFDRDKRAAGIRALKAALSAEGKDELRSYVDKKLKPMEQVVGRVMQIRNKSIAHNERAISREKVYEVNGITPNEIRQVIDVACELINHVAGELGFSDRIMEQDRMEKATLSMLAMLDRGRLAGEQPVKTG